MKSPDRDAADDTERVARALCTEAGDDPDRQYIGMDNELMLGWKLHERPARAAIAAMPSASELATLRRRVATARDNAFQEFEEYHAQKAAEAESIGYIDAANHHETVAKAMRNYPRRASPLPPGRNEG